MYLKKRLAMVSPIPSAPVLDPFYPIATAYVVTSSTESKEMEAVPFQVVASHYSPDVASHNNRPITELFKFATKYRQDQHMGLAIPCLMEAIEHPAWNQLTAMAKSQIYYEVSLNYLMQGNAQAKASSVENAVRSYDLSREYCVRAIEAVEIPSSTPGLVVMTAESIKYRRILITLGMSNDRVRGQETPARLMEWHARVADLLNVTPNTRHWMDPLLSVANIGLEAAVRAGDVNQSADSAVWIVDRTLRFYTDAKNKDVGALKVSLSVDELMVATRILATVFELIQSIPLRDTDFARLKPLEPTLVVFLKDAVSNVPIERLSLSMNDLRAALSEVWKAAPLKAGRGNIVAATYGNSPGCGCAVM